jgi:RNA polymerase sigma factor (sigma-70 family)
MREYRIDNEELTRNKTPENIDLLLKNNKGLASKAVKSYSGRFHIRSSSVLELRDLYQTAILSLYESILKYNPDNVDCKFSTYAYRYILNSLNELAASYEGTCRIPLSNYYLLRKINKYKTEYLREHEKLPTNKEISEHFEVSEDKVRKLLLLSEFASSLNEDAYNRYDPEDKIELQEVLPSDEIDPRENCEKNNIIEALQYIIENPNLKKEEQEFIIDAYGLFGRKRLTYRLLGEKYGLTYEGARVRINEIIELIKDNPIINKYGALIDIDTENRKDLGNKVKKRNNGKNLFDKFCSYTKEEVLKAVERIPDDQKELLYKRYGKDLEQTEHTGTFTQEEYNRLSHQITKTIRRCLDDPNYTYVKPHEKTLMERLNKYDREEIIKALKDLPKEYQDAIYLRYGNKFDEINEISSDIKSLITITIIPQIKKNIIRNREEENKNYLEQLIQKDNIDYTKFRIILDFNTFKKYLETLNSDDKKMLVYIIENGEIPETLKPMYNENIIKEAVACLIYGYYRFLQGHSEKLKDETYNNKEFNRRNLEKIIIRVI